MQCLNKSNDTQLKLVETETTPFMWGDIHLSQTVFIDGAPHATRTAIGEWLEYVDNPQDRIRRIVGRNTYIDDYSVAVKLTATDGKIYTNKVYHPIGFLLIVMESGQTKAQLMKKAVAEFVWHFAGPRHLSHKDKLELRKFKKSLCMDIDRAKSAFTVKALTEQLLGVCMELGESMPDVGLLKKDIWQFELVTRKELQDGDQGERKV